MMLQQCSQPTQKDSINRAEKEKHRKKGLLLC